MPKINDSTRMRNVRLAAKLYDKMYREYTGGKNFTSPAMIRDMIAYGRGKWMPQFNKVENYLHDLLKENNGYNEFKWLLKDYYGVLFEYYRRFKRVPTLKQITGPTMDSQFRAWVHKQEEELGSYWTSEKAAARAKWHGAHGWWGRKEYDPIIPHVWSGPGDPTKVPALNRGVMPIGITFRMAVRFRLIDPPQEVIDEYNRLYTMDEEDAKWVGDGSTEPVEKPGHPTRKTIKREVPKRAVLVGLNDTQSKPPRRVERAVPKRIKPPRA